MLNLPFNFQCFSLLNVTFLDANVNVSFNDEDRFIILTSIAGESTGYTTLFNFLKTNWNILKER